jgi:hypothetical protein
MREFLRESEAPSLPPGGGRTAMNTLSLHLVLSRGLSLVFPSLSILYLI